jgi:hypothetical protein
LLVPSLSVTVIRWHMFWPSGDERFLLVTTPSQASFLDRPRLNIAFSSLAAGPSLPEPAVRDIDRLAGFPPTDG